MRLPRPLAYGVSIPEADGVVCIGGCDREACYRDVFLLKWNGAAGRIETEPLPPLPRPLAMMAGARAGDVIYLAGGQETAKDPVATRNFWALDLSARGRPADFRWRELEAWPGPARISAVAAAHESGGEARFYLFSGRNVSPTAATGLLTDAYEFSPRSGRWRRLADVAPPGEVPRCVMAAPAAVVDGRILIFGGDDGGRFLRQERLERAVRAAADPEQREPLARQLAEWCDGHAGFSRDILAYNVDTNTWTKAGELPGAGRLTTAAVLWQGAIVIPTGEVRPGVRTPGVWQATAVTGGTSKP
jgi:N-acetylneuraminic acid mutarotase